MCRTPHVILWFRTLILEQKCIQQENFWDWGLGCIYLLPNPKYYIAFRMCTITVISCPLVGYAKHQMAM